jgi:protein-disulfide isomerase
MLGQLNLVRVLLVTLILAVIGMAGCVDTAPSPDEVAEAKNPDGSWNLAHYGAGNDPFLGNESALVQVIAYDAPGCSSCKRYHDTELPAIMADYVDTGRIGYHLLQWRVGYPYDIQGGIAEECAFREGGTAAYVDTEARVFANQSTLGRDGNLEVILAEVAEKFDLDAGILQTCLDDEETKDEVNADIAFGKSSGAGSNPGFAILSPSGVEIVHGAHGPADAIARALSGIEES